MAKRKKTKLPEIETPAAPVFDPVCRSCGGEFGELWEHSTRPREPLCRKCFERIHHRASPKSIQTPTNPERG